MNITDLSYINLVSGERSVGGLRRIDVGVLINFQKNTNINTEILSRPNIFGSSATTGGNALATGPETSNTATSAFGLAASSPGSAQSVIELTAATTPG